MRLPLRFLMNAVRLPARRLIPRDIVALTLLRNGRICIERPGGVQEEVQIEPGTTVSPSLIVLRLRRNDQVQSLVFPGFLTDSEFHRKLRVWLRWRPHSVQNAA